MPVTVTESFRGKLIRTLTYSDEQWETLSSEFYSEEYKQVLRNRKLQKSRRKTIKSTPLQIIAAAKTLTTYANQNH